MTCSRVNGSEVTSGERTWELEANSEEIIQNKHTARNGKYKD